MSTASRDQRPDTPAERAQDIMQAAAGRALGSRRRLRLFAITLWTGFLGAALTVVTAVVLLPAQAVEGVGWAELSIGFLVTWVLTMVAISLALILAVPADAPSDGR